MVNGVGAAPPPFLGGLAVHTIHRNGVIEFLPQGRVFLVAAIIELSACCETSPCYRLHPSQPNRKGLVVSNTAASASIPADVFHMWNSAVVESPTGKYSISKAPVGGVNWRISVVGAAAAVYKSCEWLATTTTALVTFDTLSLLKAGVKGWGVIQSLLDAIRDQMEPLEYCTYVVLAGQKGPPTRTELKALVIDYVNSFVNSKLPLPWIGMPREFLAKSAQELKDPQVFDDVLAELQKDGFVAFKGDSVLYQACNIRFGLTQSN